MSKDYSSIDLDFMTGYNKLQPVLRDIEDVEYIDYLFEYEWNTRRNHTILDRLITRKNKINRREDMKILWEKMNGSTTESQASKEEKEDFVRETYRDLPKGRSPEDLY